MRAHDESLIDGLVRRLVDADEEPFWSSMTRESATTAASTLPVAASSSVWRTFSPKTTRAFTISQIPARIKASFAALPYGAMLGVRDRYFLEARIGQIFEALRWGSEPFFDQTARWPRA